MNSGCLCILVNYSKSVPGSKQYQNYNALIAKHHKAFRLLLLLHTLPNGYPFIFGFIHFIGGLQIKGVVERCKVHQWCVNTPPGRWVRIGVYIHAHKLIGCFYTPYSCYRDKETLIGCKAIQFGGVFSLCGHFKGIISNGNPGNVCRIFTRGQRAFTCIESSTVSKLYWSITCFVLALNFS